MVKLKPKDFIQQVLINEIKPLTISSPYLAFALMAIGIEFLGKCLDTSTDNWNKGGRSKANFINAINTLPGLQFYEGYEEGLFVEIRCGFAHSFVPGPHFTLSSKDQSPHMSESGGRVNLRCEDFYEDFKTACEAVIGMSFPAGGKMNEDFLGVPDPVLPVHTPSAAGTSETS
jgi:hypothetical protein